MSTNEKPAEQTTPHLLGAADVTLSDGRVVRMSGKLSGKLAVDYYKRNPEAVRKFIEDERARAQKPPEQTTVEPNLSWRRFALRAGRIAQLAATYAADALATEVMSEPARQESVHRFATEIRARLDAMEADCAGQ